MRNMSTENALDRIDCGILAALQKDGRLSNKELAAQVGLAPSSCLARVRRLRSSGVLTGFHADVDAAAVGVGLQAMVAISLRDHRPEPTEDFQALLRAMPEVVGIFHVGGTIDLLVHLAARDTAHLREMVHHRITGQSQVDKVQTMILFDYEWRSLPIFHEGG